MEDLPVEFGIINAISDSSDKPYDKGKCGQVQQVAHHHDVESMLLVIIVHPREK